MSAFKPEPSDTAKTLSDEEIRMIQNRLNNRPRKRLGFKTPAEVFHQSLKRVALRT
jgi:IS30 family transposase